MSEYQYYEFCKLNQPISKPCRDEMRALSKRAKIGTHGVSFTYDYGDFCNDEKKLLAKYFDVFFYISNFGDLVLMFRYAPDEINLAEIKPYLAEDVVDYEQIDGQIIITLTVNDQNGGFGGWLEGEAILAELLQLYDELKNGDYQILTLLQTISAIHNDEDSSKISVLVDNLLKPLSPAQKELLKIIEVSLSEY